MNLEELERRENLKQHRLKLKQWKNETNHKIINTKLDDILIGFIDKYKLDSNDEIIYYLRKYNQFIKNN